MNTFLISFRLRIAYRTNGFLHSLKSILLVRRFLPGNIYDHQGLKILGLIVAAFRELGSIFFGKLFYIGLMIVLPLTLLERSGAGSYYHLLLFLTLEGMLINNPLFDPSQDKYYAMFLLRMDAKRYVLTDYGYYLVKLLLGFALAGALAALLLEGLSPMAALWTPLFVLSGKLTASALTLWQWRRKGTLISSEKQGYLKLALNVTLLAAAYAPVALWGLAVPMAVFFAVLALFAALGIWGAISLVAFPQFRKVYKEQFAHNSTFITPNTANLEQTAVQSKLVVDVGESRKTGWDYFHDLFVRRHRKLLTRSARVIAIVAAAIIAVAAVLCLVDREIASGIGNFLATSLPMFLFIMYWVNRGRSLTQALFYNCDHSMLTYRFFRQPKMILQLFTARLKTLVAINLLPAAVIAAGLPLLLYLSGGAQHPIYYAVLPLSILAMSVFFSVHTLVLYYLLQPYNIGLETKSPAYSIANGLTYFVCYMTIDLELPTLLFGAIIIGFCLLYVAVALVLAYRLAPKTFKLRA